MVTSASPGWADFRVFPALALPPLGPLRESTRSYIHPSGCNLALGLAPSKIIDWNDRKYQKIEPWAHDPRLPSPET